MPQPPQSLVASFVGILVQLGGAILLVGFFNLLRRYVFRRAYFSAWVMAWLSITIAILAVVGRYLVPEAPDGAPIVRLLYFVYQSGKLIGLACFLRGTALYVSGGRAAGTFNHRTLVVGAIGFAAGSALWARSGLTEMVVWQSILAVPILGYCGSALLWLPRPRRTLGTVATGVAFCMLGALWLAYGGAFALSIHNANSPLGHAATVFIGYNSYFDLLLDVLLGYGMVVLLMEDAKREVADAQAELRLSHDRLNRAAMIDSLTDSLNRRAFVEGVGLEMARATFGTVVIADIDNLKLVNDQHGHAVGDLLIRRCADVLRATLRPYDKLYRWGGDEFLLIVPSAHAADMLVRLQISLASADVLHSPTDGAQVRLEVSLGAADYEHAGEIGQAIDRADREMYLDKGRRKGEPRNTPDHMRVSQIASRG